MATKPAPPPQDEPVRREHWENDDIFEYDGCYYVRGKRELEEITDMLRFWKLKFKLSDFEIEKVEQVRGYWYYSLFEDQHFTIDPRSNEWTKVTLKT